MVNWEQHYRTARKLVGDLNRDLVHHTWEMIHDVIDINKNPDTFFHKVMVIESKNMYRFNKENAPVHPRAKMYRNITDTGQGIRPENSAYFEYDPQKVQRILNQLKREGKHEEVEIFNLHVIGVSVTDINKQTGVCRRIIGGCIKYVRHEVKQRYGNSRD